MSGPGIHPYHHQHHRQWPQPLPVMHSLAPPPPIPGEIPGHSSIDEVRTIFISGLPGDVKERELLSLLRWLPGFEASQINSKGEQSMGFALFSTPQHAVAAKNALQNAKDNPPCNTLFVGNLGENVVEEELKGLFSMQPGYKQMKILCQEKNTVCFIQFDDVASATTVHVNLQGVDLLSSGRGGIRLQFSKNPFGRRKDSANVAATETNGTTTTY